MYLSTVFSVAQAPFFPQSYYYMVGSQQPPVYLYTPPPITNQSLSPLENKKVFKPKRPRGYTSAFIEGSQESELEQSQSSNSYKPNRKQHKITKNSGRGAKAKPERNALTNIGNQILTFVYLKKKNFEVLRRLCPRLSVQQTRSYYLYAREIKQALYGYINYEKLGKLWHNQFPSDPSNYRIMRRLSYIYIRDMLVQAIITSKKMPNDGKPLHLKVRRCMLSYFHDSQSAIP